MRACATAVSLAESLRRSIRTALVECDVQALAEEPKVEALAEEPKVDAEVEEPKVEALVDADVDADVESDVEALVEEPKVEALVEPDVQALVEEPKVEALVDADVQALAEAEAWLKKPAMVDCLISVAAWTDAMVDGTTMVDVAASRPPVSSFMVVSDNRRLAEGRLSCSSAAATRLTAGLAVKKPVKTVAALAFSRTAFASASRVMVVYLLTSRRWSMPTSRHWPRRRRG